MAFSEDLSVFFNAAEFADLATLGGVEVSGIFNAAYSDTLGMYGSGPVFILPSAVSAGTQQGDLLSIGAANYTVAGVEPDGTGVTLLRLQEA